MGLADVAELLPFRRALEAVAAAETASAAQVCGGPLREAKRLVAVPGSFNPPHAAHLALLEAGMDTAGGSGAFVLSHRTVDKERPTGLLLEDRLWLLCRLLQDGGSAGDQECAALPGVLVTNRGLYVDQAAALRALCPPLEDLVFVVGYDKIVQIFDPRYYVDRDRALAELFARARFLVAPRDTSAGSDLEALLADAANRPYAGRVTPLPINPALASVSSSAVRAAVAAGARDADGLPLLVRQFIGESGCYSPGGDAYARRAAALASAR